MSDFNAFDSTPFGSFRDSRFDARGRTHPFTVRYWAKCTEPSVTVGGDSGTVHVSRFKAVVGLVWGIARRRNPSAPVTNDYAEFQVAINSAFIPPFQTVRVGGWIYDDWNHVVAGFDGDSIFIQLNNSARVTAPFGRVPPTPGGSLRVRGYPTSILGFQPAVVITTLDEMAIWNDRALSEAEVADDWNGGAGRDYASTSPADLLAYWDFDAFSPGADQFTDNLDGRILTWSDSQVGAGTRTIVTGKIASAVNIDFFPWEDFGGSAGYYGIVSDDFDFSG